MTLAAILLLCGGLEHFAFSSNAPHSTQEVIAIIVLSVFVGIFIGIHFVCPLYFGEKPFKRD